MATLRYKGSVAEEEWDLWRVQTRDGKPQMAVTLNGFDRTVMFTTTSKAPNGIQTVTFSQQTAKVGNTVVRLCPPRQLQLFHRKPDLQTCISNMRMFKRKSGSFKTVLHYGKRGKAHLEAMQVAKSWAISASKGLIWTISVSICLLYL